MPALVTGGTSRVMPPGLMLAMLVSCSHAREGQAAVPDPLSARMLEGEFQNPPGGPSVSSGWSDGLSLWWKMAWVSPEDIARSVPAGHALPETKAIALLDSLKQADTVTWLGHASFLIRLGGKTVLTDPYLTEYASPISIGPKRYVAPGISIERLPPIDLLLISHNHYDHLDRRTLARLPRRDRTTVVVPLGLADSLREFGFKEVREVTWGQTNDFDALRVTAVPAIHSSGRGLADENETLWAGYVLASAQAKIYFAGDTAYHGLIFKRIRETHGAMDIALVPIGAYEPTNMMAHVHVDPQEAVAIGRDVGAKRLVPMHWGTVVLATEPPFEPPTRFRAAGRLAGASFPKRRAAITSQSRFKEMRIEGQKIKMIPMTLTPFRKIS